MFVLYGKKEFAKKVASRQPDYVCASLQLANKAFSTCEYKYDNSNK
jgi:hypothetical protein